jgi:hypothetical protein
MLDNGSNFLIELVASYVEWWANYAIRPIDLYYANTNVHTKVRIKRRCDTFDETLDFGNV